MARINVRLDRVGIRQVLQSAPMRSMVAEAGGRVAESIRASGHVAHSGAQASGAYISGDVDVRSGVGNYDQRAVALVTIQHPAAIAIQAKYGVMTRAARSLGAGASWNARG